MALTSMDERRIRDANVMVQDQNLTRWNQNDSKLEECNLQINRTIEERS